MSRVIAGNCLCGRVTFKVNDEFSMFHLCHCTQCQKITGSAFASNIFTRPDNIEWVKGIELAVRYDDPERHFTKVFCSKCGSGLPFLTQSGKYIIVPAGSLSEQPEIRPQDNIFWSEHIAWLDDGLNANKFARFPE